MCRNNQGETTMTQESISKGCLITVKYAKQPQFMAIINYSCFVI